MPSVEVGWLQEDLARIQPIALLYPRQGEEGPGRTASMASESGVVRQALTAAFVPIEIHPSGKHSKGRWVVCGREHIVPVACPSRGLAG